MRKQGSLWGGFGGGFPAIISGGLSVFVSDGGAV